MITSETSVSNVPHPAEFVATFILDSLKSAGKYGKSGTFLKPSDPDYLALKIFPSLEQIAGRRLKGISHHINETLVAWGGNRIQLHLKLAVPTAGEVLEMQCRGERCVTCILAPDSLANYIDDDHDELGFCLHDLMHAYHFFKDPGLKLAQIGFARTIKKLLVHGIFENHMRSQLFTKKLEYAISDMNSHPIHLLKYLRAIIDTADIPCPAIWPDFALLASDDPLIYSALLAVNRATENAQTNTLLTVWLTEVGAR